MQIYSVARNVLGALGPKVKVPVLDSELKIPAECLRIVGALDAGSIIEQGENANGRYTKWADGTMICSKTFTNQTQDFNVNYGGLYRINNFYISFPAVFIDIPCVPASSYAPNIATTTDARCGSRETAEIFVFKVGNGIVSNLTISYVAMGRWK